MLLYMSIVFPFVAVNPVASMLYTETKKIK